MNNGGRTEETDTEKGDKDLWSKCISREKKHLFYHSIFKSIVLYECETWQLTTN